MPTDYQDVTPAIAPLPEAHEEEIEGIDSESASWGDYPLDSLAIRTEQRTAMDVVRRIKSDRFVMNPEFQRDFVWPPDKQSRLIESVLLRIPLPVFYVAEDNDGRLVVVDGLQRLTTFTRFLSGEFGLKLEDRKELNKKHFSELPMALQNRVEDCQLTLYIIDATVPERARLDIFERVNGGEPLTRQQMRNCLYMGPSTRFLKTEAEHVTFAESTSFSKQSKNRMRDREFVNRFVSFYLLPLADYRDKEMDGWLAQGLKLLNKMDDNQIEGIRMAFRRSVQLNIELFGVHAFRKWRDGAKRSTLNASLFDVTSVLMARLPEHIERARLERVRLAIIGLFASQKFVNCLTYGPNGKDEVRYRFEAAERAVSEAINAI